MPIISGRYWNMVHGFTPDDVRKDAEGLQNLRYVARNMVYHLRCKEAAAKAEALSAFAALSLKITVVVSLVFNLLQLMFIRRLLVVDVSVNLPIVSLAFMLALALLSRLVRENKALKDDNDLFI